MYSLTCIFKFQLCSLCIYCTWYLHIQDLAQISPPEIWDLLVSDASWYHHREAQNHSPEHSRSPFLAGVMISPPPHPEYWIPVNFQATTENSYLSNLLDYLKKKKTFTFSKSSSFSFSFSPSLASMYLFEQGLRLGVIGTSSVCLPLQD